VEEVGIDRWYAARADDEGLRRYRAHRERRAAFTALLIDHKRKLEALYAQPIDDAEKRRGKQAVFDSLRVGYEQLKVQWGGFAGYDRWFDEPLTNAHLAAVGAYADLLPAFRNLLKEAGGQLPVFYARVRELAALPTESRQQRLQALSARP
jgi:predicted aminopeptidase